MKSSTVFRLRFNRNYITFVATSRGTVPVSFLPIVRYGRQENSMFSTNNEEIISGLKKNPDYGSLFDIEIEGKEEHPTSAQPQASAEEKPIEAQPEPESSTGSDSSDQSATDGVIHETTVTSKNKAIAYLAETFNQLFTQTANIAEMKQEALDTYHVIFDNWK